MIPWRGPKTSLQGCKHTPRLRQGSLQDGLGPRTRRRQQKSQFMQGPFDDGKGLTRQQALSGRRQQKFHFVQGPFHDGKGLTGNKPIPGRGASKKSHFRQGSFADGKGRTGKKPTLAGAQAKNPISGRGRVQRARA